MKRCNWQQGIYRRRHNFCIFITDATTYGSKLAVVSESSRPKSGTLFSKMRHADRPQKCNLVKSTCRLVCIFQSLLLGGLVAGSSVAFALWPEEVVKHYPIITIAELYLPDKPILPFYLLGTSLFLSLPFVLMAILGTKCRCLIITCVMSNSITILHTSTLSIICLFDGFSHLLQWTSITAFLFSQILVLIIITATLRIRQNERTALHSAQLISRRNSELIVIN
jgi:hypothetical protein